ncbi:MAG: MBL fold metallo-hydrolase [Cyclobacteriaceae bacterium]|jgi:L-ascorbate metabolism protein UlaG (beta-lactamase superfamily)|nr:MBL fold metallo-hydrolase [Cyclobacteriaceae bacterium]
MKYSNKITALIFLILLTVVSVKSYGQKDKIPTKNGELTIIPINHATLAIEWNNEVIYFDPSGKESLFEGLARPTIILITDIHGDHLDVTTLEQMNFNKVKIIGPKAVIDKLPSTFSDIISLDNSIDLDINGINIQAIPMYNLPETSDSRHPKGRGNGYVLTVGGKRIYISGDTEDIQEMRSLKDIDVAFVCMNLPYTMDVDAAASAVLDFEPKIVYPFHYRGQGGLSDVAKFKELVQSKNSSIDVRLRNWYGQ